MAERLILVVEENSTDALIVKHALRKHFQVEHVRSRREAQECLKKNSFSAVVTNYSLSESNGLALQQWIIAEGLEVPVIIMSGVGDERVAAEALKLGAYDYLVKSEESLSSLGAVIEQVLRRHELEQHAQILQQIVEHASEAIITMQTDGRILTANRAVEVIFGHRPEEVVGKPFTLLFPEDKPSGEARQMLDAGASGLTWAGDVPAQRKDGSLFPANVSCSVLRHRSGRTRCLIGIVRDVTERRQFLDKLKRLSVTDNLTGLFNHRFFHDRLRYEFIRARRYGDPLGCIMIDVDFFKTVNDTYGHLLGDEVLKALAGTISRATRAVDVVARYGGEEFAILLPCTDLDGTVRCAEHVWESVGTSEIRTRQGSLRLTVCAGAAALTDSVKDEEDLCHRADAALLAAKRHGRNNVHIWDPTLVEIETAPETLQGRNFEELRASLRRAVSSAKGRYVEAVQPLLEAWCQRHPSLQRRMANVTIFATELGRAAGMKPNELEALHHAALLQVIAGAATAPHPSEASPSLPPGAPADPPTALSRAGEQLARELAGFELETEYLRHCCEEYGGSASPESSARQGIPLGARVLAVADAYDALLSARSQDPTFTDATAIAALRAQSGQGLDPALADLFVEAREAAHG